MYSNKIIKIKTLPIFLNTPLFKKINLKHFNTLKFVIYLLLSNLNINSFLSISEFKEILSLTIQ